jgi:hypothetical protein
MNSYAGSSVEKERMIRGNGEERVLIFEAIGLQILGFIIFGGWFGKKMRMSGDLELEVLKLHGELPRLTRRSIPPHDLVTSWRLNKSSRNFIYGQDVLLKSRR